MRNTYHDICCFVVYMVLTKHRQTGIVFKKLIRRNKDTHTWTRTYSVDDPIQFQSFQWYL